MYCPCPECNQHYRKKYGNIRRCTCGYFFVFGHRSIIKDRLMLFLEKKASKNGIRYFTIDKLYAVYQKHWLSRQPIFGFFSKKTSAVSQHDFFQMHNRWQKNSSLRSDKFFEKRICCPECNQHYKKSQGIISKCRCGYCFVFGYNDVIKDHLMFFLEEKASQKDTRYFTIDKLYTAYQKHQTNHAKKGIRVKTTLNKDAIAKIHSCWQNQSSLKSDKFIDKPRLEQPENSIGEEVFHYGIERIIVVDEPLKVDLFVKNNKHIKKKALIISSTGYPNYLKPQVQDILAKQPNVPVSFLYKSNQAINEQQTRFEKNCQVKLQDGQVWDMSVDQKSTTLLEAKKTDVSVDQKSTTLKVDKFDLIGNKSNNVTRIISAGIIVTIIFSAIISIVIYNNPTVHYPNEKEKSDIPETNKNVGSAVEKEILNEPNVNSKQACYKLTVNAMPSDSRIRIMNIKPKYKHGICLKKGNYDIYVTHKNHTSYRKWVKVEDREVSISITLDGYSK